jgi:hypothetical protein
MFRFKALTKATFRCCHSNRPLDQSAGYGGGRAGGGDLKAAVPFISKISSRNLYLRTEDNCLYRNPERIVHIFHFRQVSV